MPWVLAAIGSLAMMSVIEWLKHVIWPGISTWESHSITILLTTAIISIAARIIFRYVQMHSEAQSLMASIVESSDDGIIGQTMNGTIVSWNRGAERVFGFSPEEVMGRSISIVIPRDRHGELPGIVEKVTREEHITNYETVCVRKDGSPIHVSITVSPIAGDSQKIVGTSIIVRDVSEQKRVQEELAKSNRQLRDLYRRLQSAREEERTRIAREIHDEFGQILTAFKIDLAWMKKQLYDDPAPLFEKIESMSKITSAAIRSIKKLSADLRPAILDDFGLHAAIEWQAEEFENRTGTKCEVEMDVGEFSIDSEVSTALFRIMQETLTNVMRHAAAKHVAMQLKARSGELIFEVRDDGRGISGQQINAPPFLWADGNPGTGVCLGGDG